MRGADITSSRLAAPPLPPLPAAGISSHRLIPLGHAVVDCTWRLGLPSWFWGEGVALSGILRLSQALGEPVSAEVHEWLGRWLRGGVEVDHVNNLAPGIAAVLASPDEPDYLDLVEPLARWAESAPLATRAANGALEHWPGDVWADTAFMAGVFLGHLGATGGNASRLDECGRQLVAHADILQSSQHGLFAHGCHRGDDPVLLGAGQRVGCAGGRRVPRAGEVNSAGRSGDGRAGGNRASAPADRTRRPSARPRRMERPRRRPTRMRRYRRDIGRRRHRGGDAPVRPCRPGHPAHGGRRGVAGSAWRARRT